MSRCILDNEKAGYEVAIGWDSMMNTFFCQVIRSGEDDPFIWLGTTPDKYLVPDVPLKAILPYAYPCREEVLRANLLEDRRNDAERIYSIDGDTVC